MPTALELTPKQWRTYKPFKTIKAHFNQKDLTIRKAEALKLARKAARLLRKKFGASKVAVFGSLAHQEWFSPWSDIDLAVWGIVPESFYAAVAEITGLSPSFRIDLIDIGECKPAFREAIEEEGIEI